MHDDEQWAATDEESGWPEEMSSQGTGLAALAGTFVMGVVTCLLVVLAWGAFVDDDGGGTTDGSAALSGSEQLAPGPVDAEVDATDPSAQDNPVATRLSRCSRAARTLDEPLEAARPALNQWGVHVGAMNKLVVGEITLPQATAFWERTRVGAQRRVAAFRDAMKTVQRRGVDCPSPDLLAPGARALPGCVRAVEAKKRTLRAAMTSVDMWDEHVSHMDMLRRGELSPEDATSMWLSMWQVGVRDLDAYRAKARETRRLAGCTRGGAAG